MTHTYTDSIKSAITMLGSAVDDKSQARVYCPPSVSYDRLMELHATGGLASVMVDSVVDAALRAGWTLDGDGAEETMVRWKRLGVKSKLRTAWILARVGGGAGVLAGPPVGSSVDWSRPPPPDTPVGWMSVYSGRVLRVHVGTDPVSPRYGTPTSYTLGATEIHPEWILHFDGIEPLDRVAAINKEMPGWGHSFLAQVYEPLLAYMAGAQALSHLLEEYKDTNLRVPELFTVLADDKARDALVARAALMKRQGGNNGVRILDMAEEWTSVYATLTGLADALDPLQLQLSAVSRIPVSMLFGRGAAGLANQTEADRETFAQDVHTEAEHVLRGPLTQLLRRTAPHAELEFESPTSSTTSERAAVGLTNAQADSLRIADGVLTPAEVRDNRYGGDPTWELDADYEAPTNDPDEMLGDDDLLEDDMLEPGPVAPAGPELKDPATSPVPDEPLVSAAIAAERMGVSPASIRGMIRRGELKQVWMIGRRPRVLMSEVVEVSRLKQDED